MKPGLRTVNWTGLNNELDNYYLPRHNFKSLISVEDMEVKVGIPAGNRWVRGEKVQVVFTDSPWLLNYEYLCLHFGHLFSSCFHSPGFVLSTLCKWHECTELTCACVCVCVCVGGR